MIRSSRLCQWAILAAGGSVVHELRYLAQHGHEADHVLAEHGHGYLTWVTPFVGLLLAAAAAQFAWSAWQRREGAPERTRRMTVVELSAALLAIHVGQELVEGVLAPGHPSGIATVLGDGGWLALPLSIVVAGVLTVVTRGAGRLVHAVLGRSPIRAPGCRRRALRPAPAAVGRPRPPLSRHGAERAPPALLAS